MKHLLALFLIIPAISFASVCPDLNGIWKGMCDRDGVFNEESINIRQNGCEEINFYGIVYKIGLPYEVKRENKYAHMVNIHNLYWGQDGNSLFFNVDRIERMKFRNEVSTGEGIGVIRVNDDQMDYSRVYSSRSRDGVYTKKTRKCKFTRQ